MATNMDGGPKRIRSRRQAKRARAALVWGGVLFVALNGAANRWLPEKIKPWSDPAYHVRRELLVRRLGEQADSQTRIAATFGSSRFMGGIDGRSLERELNEQTNDPWFVINFASAGGGPIDSLVRLHRLLRQGPQPSLVLFEVLPNQLNAASVCSPPVSQESEFDGDDLEFLHRVGITVSAAQRRRPLDSPGVLWQSCVLWQFRRDVLRMTYPRLLHGGDAASMMRACDQYGTIPLSAEATLPQRQAALAVAKNTYVDGASRFQLGGDGLKAMEEAARLCRARDLSFVFVIMPEGPTFRSWYRAGVQDELRDAVAAIADRWNGRVVDRWDALPEESFVDSHHLLATAAGPFSSDLARRSLTALDLPLETPRVSARDVRTERRQN